MSHNDNTSDVNHHLAFNVQRNFHSQGGNFQQANRSRGGYNGRYNNYRGRGNQFSTRGRGFHQQISSSPNRGGSYKTWNQNSRPTCQICGRVDHQALKCWNRYDNTFQSEDMPNDLAAMSVSTDENFSGQEWYPDTEATSHITNSSHNLLTAQPYGGMDSVMVGDGSYLPITHIGSTNLPVASGQAIKEATDPGKKAT